MISRLCKFSVYVSPYESVAPKLPKFCKDSLVIFIGKNKKSGKVKITKIVNTKPNAIRKMRATNPNTLEIIKKATFSIKTYCCPVILSIFHGENKVFIKIGIENTLKA